MLTETVVPLPLLRGGHCHCCIMITSDRCALIIADRYTADRWPVRDHCCTAYCSQLIEPTASRPTAHNSPNLLLHDLLLTTHRSMLNVARLIAHRLLLYADHCVAHRFLLAGIDFQMLQHCPEQLFPVVIRRLMPEQRQSSDSPFPTPLAQHMARLARASKVCRECTHKGCKQVVQHALTEYNKDRLTKCCETKLQSAPAIENWVRVLWRLEGENLPLHFDSLLSYDSATTGWLHNPSSHRSWLSRAVLSQGKPRRVVCVRRCKHVSGSCS